MSVICWLAVVATPFLNVIDGWTVYPEQATLSSVTITAYTLANTGSSPIIARATSGTVWEHRMVSGSPLENPPYWADDFYFHGIGNPPSLDYVQVGQDWSFPDTTIPANKYIQVDTNWDRKMANQHAKTSTSSANRYLDFFTPRGFNITFPDVIQLSPGSGGGN